MVLHEIQGVSEWRQQTTRGLGQVERIQSVARLEVVRGDSAVVESWA